MPNWSIWASTWAWCAWRADKFSLFHTKPLWEGASPLPHLNRGALTVPGARAVLAAFHIGILKVRIVLTAAREGGLFQVALTELGLLQISIAQIRPLQVGLAQPGHFQVGGAQVGLVHLCPGQPGELQVSRAQVGVSNCAPWANRPQPWIAINVAPVKSARRRLLCCRLARVRLAPCSWAFSRLARSRLAWRKSASRRSAPARFILARFWLLRLAPLRLAPGHWLCSAMVQPLMTSGASSPLSAWARGSVSISNRGRYFITIPREWRGSRGEGVCSRSAAQQS